MNLISKELFIKVESSLSDQSINHQNNIEYPSSNDQHIFQSVSPDRIEDSVSFINENTSSVVSISTYRGRCPLTFDGAFGINKSDHSICFCSKTKVRKFNLYQHLTNKHQLKRIYARRLIKALKDNLDPKTIILFDSNEDIIDPLYRLKKKQFSNIPCQCRPIALPDLKSHLKHHHRLSNSLAKKLVEYYKTNQIEN